MRFPLSNNNADTCIDIDRWTHHGEQTLTILKFSLLCNKNTHSLSLSLSPDGRQRRSAKSSSALLEVIEAAKCPFQHTESVGTEVRALNTVARMTRTSLQLGT